MYSKIILAGLKRSDIVKEIVLAAFRDEDVPELELAPRCMIPGLFFCCTIDITACVKLFHEPLEMTRVRMRKNKEMHYGYRIP